MFSNLFNDEEFKGKKKLFKLVYLDAISSKIKVQNKSPCVFVSALYKTYFFIVFNEF